MLKCVYGGKAMMTVNEVSKLTGVSIRTLHYYDKIGLLHPTEVTESGYRLYDDTALEHLQQILLFRELEFPLKEIKTIINSKDFNRTKALEQQIELLTLKKEHLENLILFARGIKVLGVKRLDFSVFNKGKLDEYAKRAKEQWGKTEAYKEYEQRRNADNEKYGEKSNEDTQRISVEFMGLFAELGKLKGLEPDSDKVQEQIGKIRDYITDNFYDCKLEIFKYLGQMYGGGGEFTDNIDEVAGAGTGEFAQKAVEIYCAKRSC